MISSRGSFTSERIANRQKKTPYAFFFFISILIFLPFFYYSLSSVSDTLVKEWVYRISKWDTIRNLDEKFDLPVSSWRYSLWIKWFAPEIKNLQVGEYRVTLPTDLETFFTSNLTKPNHIDETITILPWWNIYDIDEYLSWKNIIPKWEFLKNMVDNYSKYEAQFDFLKGKESFEWFLYPDTYRIRTNADVDEITLKLLWQFDKVIWAKYHELWEDGYQELILASIVVREERSNSEQPVVAWVLAKRVLEWIPMGADATVCTWYSKTQKECTPSFIGEVITKKHPYNTRNKQGYPPTPISNVPVAVWDNTLARSSSPYYYYLHDSDWKIHYARTLDEHIANKNMYLR